MLRGTYHAPLGEGGGDIFCNHMLRIRGKRMSRDNKLLGVPLLSQIQMDLILPRTLMSRVVIPTNCACEQYLLFLFHATPLIIFHRINPLVSVGIILFIPLLISSSLLRIL